MTLADLLGALERPDLARQVIGEAPATGIEACGVAYDSPQAYDEVASSALAFADDEQRGIADEAEFDENLTGYLIRRTPRSGGKTAARHATRKKSPAQLDRDVHKALILSLKQGAKIIANGYPGTVVRVTPYGMVEVRLPGGVAAVGPEDVQIR